MNSTHKISIEEIEKQGELTINFNDVISEISEKPLIAELTLKSLGGFIEVKGFAKGIAKLQCDLCLKDFDYKIDIKINEIYAKNGLYEEYGAETEIKDGQFIEDLNGENEIDIYDLLYQSVILDFPNKKVCDINCKGGDIFIRENNSDEIDPRLAVFKDIQINKK